MVPRRGLVRQLPTRSLRPNLSAHESLHRRDGRLVLRRLHPTVDVIGRDPRDLVVRRLVDVADLDAADVDDPRRSCSLPRAGFT